MSALLATPVAPVTSRPNGLTPHDAIVLDAKGRIDLGDGAVLVRPLHERVAPPAPPLAGHLATSAELEAIRSAWAPLAGVVERLQEVEYEIRELRFALRGADLRVEQAQLDALHAEHGAVRGAARLAMLDTLDSATLRAGAKYRTVCDMAKAITAELEALAELRADLTGATPDFDPLGAWRRMALLAPPHRWRPPGWSTCLDAYGRDCYWTASSAAHLDAVRAVKSAFRAEITAAAPGAPWPFD